MSYLNLIGNTPTIKYKNIFVKLEKYNLSGSVKDRAVLGILQDMQTRGELTTDTVIVEASSGNTGISLAALAPKFNVKAIIFMPQSVSKERRSLIKAYGATLNLVAGPMSLAVKEANDLIASNPKIYRSLNQFNHPANPKFHENTTAKEILKDVPNIDVLVAGFGTAGTIVGTSRGIKKEKDLYVVGIEPASSPLISQGKASSHKIMGIGADFIPGIYDNSLINEVVTVSDEDAINMMLKFTKDTGIGVGISSGANILVALDYAQRNPNKTVVTIAPDGLDKYLSVISE